MKFLKKNSIVVIFLFGSILNSLPLMASVKDIVVNNLSLAKEGKDLFVDFDQELYMSPEMIDGLKNGILLVFDIIG